MATYPTFPNAPITEAVLDIRVALPEEFELNKLDVYESVKNDFPEKKKQNFFESSISLSNNSEPKTLPTKTGLRGYLFVSHKDNQVFQSRVDGFTFNKLKPYRDWKSFSSESKKLWGIYHDAVKPIKVISIVLRYINRIEVPLPFDSFNEYIKTNPQIAEGLPQSISQFFMRLEMPNPDIGAMAIITQTMDKPTKNERLPLILDIQVFINKDYSESENDGMWKDFEKLHDFKNDIFFKSITDKTKELFK